MKRVSITYIFSLLLMLGVQAQSSFFYQATLRNTEGKPIAKKDLTVRISILSDATTVYAETHEAKTDDNGYYRLYIGEGNPETGNFSQTDWSKGEFQLQAEINQGSGYTLTGSQKLSSVPYAMLVDMAGGIQQNSADGTTWNVVVDNEGNLSTEKEESQNIPIPAGYTQLVFNDEFNGTGLPDATKWKYEEGWKRNDELQYYTVAREENIYQKDGLLHIKCINDSVFIKDALLNEWTNLRKDTVAPITSASITTKGIAAWTYCRVDMRAKLPMCLGTWPAIWMMPVRDLDIIPNGYTKGWPNSGEIDIMEHVGYAPENVHFTLHCKNHNSGTWPNLYNRSVNCPTSYTEFHTYTLEWTEERISWYLDGRLRFYVSKPLNATWENWPFIHDFYLILNHAFGGGWGGQGKQIVDRKALPQDYQIDYVRVFKK